MSSLLTDETARNDAARTLEGLSFVSRRIGASLLRRAAERGEELVGASGGEGAARGGASELLKAAPNALADAIEPTPQERREVR